MRKIIYFFIIGFLLTACGNSEPEPLQEPIVKQERQPEQKQIIITPTEPLEVETTVPEKEIIPLYKLNPANWSIKRIDGNEEKSVLLTIDDAPDQNALSMAQTLKKQNVNAIFFVNGHFLDTPEEKQVLKQIHEMGFMIGNHTSTHSSLPNLSEEEQRNEIIGLNDQVEEIIGVRPVFFRAPYGANTDFSKELAKKEGMLVMNWTYGYDWEKEYQDKDSLTEIMVNSPYLTNGANLLIHDRKWTAQALKGIINGLREKGYTFIDPHLIQTP
jgi:peptidoglycan/xylan/chitin deacetylase (PgdA/CDA1 family)